MINWGRIMTAMRKIGIYIAGLFILALGVSVSIKSNLGISPVNSLPYVLSHIVDLEMGYFTMGVFIAFIGLQVAILRREFKIINALQILCSIAFGYFVNLSNFLLSFFTTPDHFLLRLVIAISSAALCGLGIFLYVEARVMPLPAEGLTKAISDKTGKPFAKVKVMFDLTMVVVSLAFSLIFLGRIQGIGIGTLISAFFIGKFVGVFSGILKNNVKRFIGEKEDRFELSVADSGKIQGGN